MAEWAVFSLASKILSTIASPAFDKAYKRGLSIWKARDELAKLRVSIETIQAVLLDAEKKQESSAAVKNWIKRLKGVLYDADDLFDEVATVDLLKQQMMEGTNKLSLKKKVRVSCSKLNPTVTRNSIAKKVKAIRKSLDEISSDMAQFEFVRCQHEEPIFGVRRGQDPGCYVDAKDVFGRDEDKKAILEMLFNELDDDKSDVPVVIAIVGIGGMGKTTLAQLIYNDDEVKRNFEKRWFACISDISDEKQVLEKFFQSICEENYSGFTVSQLHTKIRQSIQDKNFLLILDDVWDEDHDKWLKRMSLLGGGAKGSRIIVTTRSTSVARAICALKTHNLDGLLEDESWALFKRVAFTPEQENDPRWTDAGREIVKKCANVPLAIRSIASLLFEKNTIQEWESIRDEKLPWPRQSHEDGIMPVLKLSYDHLCSNLKQCFAYCSLFPKDYRVNKRMLIYLWIAQGYVKQNNEDMGHSNFMYLLRRGFFQEAKEDRFGEIESCKMHDLIHDLAQHVAGEESTMLSSTSSNTSNYAKHASAWDFKIDESWSIPASLLNVNRLRSCLLMNGGSICNSTLLDQLFANFKQLRTLRLPRLGIENVPSSIGELKHLRYLDLSWNKFQSLPNSVTNLVNLLTLDINWCSKLKALPDDLKKLIHLRYLSIWSCDSLKHMPAGIGEMSCLQYLSHFKVGRTSIEEEGIKQSGLDQLVGLKQLRGYLLIDFEHGISDWDGDECWKLPVSPQRLEIWDYPGRRIPDWGINRRANNLASLVLCYCKSVKYLPPLRCLPYLRQLVVYRLWELEFMEDGDNCTTIAGSSSFFPLLERLELVGLTKLKGWWSEVATSSSMFLSFPHLSHLEISECPELKSIPLWPHLTKLVHHNMNGNEVIEQVLSNNYNSSPTSTTTPSLSSSFQHILISPLLQKVYITDCSTLEVMHVTSLKLQQLWISSCPQLNELCITHPNILEELFIEECPELELWQSQDKIGVDWDSLSNLRRLCIHPLPPQEKLPRCLRHRQSLGLLKITKLKITKSDESPGQIQLVSLQTEH